jgi:hypothetical protein
MLKEAHDWMTNQRLKEIKFSGIANFYYSTTRLLLHCHFLVLMERLLSSQLTELRIKNRHRQLLCGRMGYGGEVLLLQ